MKPLQQIKFLIFAILISLSSTCWCKEDYGPYLIKIEQGGIDNQGQLADKKDRLRTNLLPSCGCVKLKMGYAIMNAVQYNEDGSFCKLLTLKYSNGFYFWNSFGNIRISFYCIDNSKSVLTSEDIPFEEFYIGDAEMVNMKTAPPKDLALLRVETNTVIQTSDVNNGSILRIPQMIAFDNGDLFLACEEHLDDGKIKYLHSFSKDGKSFSFHKTSLPIINYIYDKKNDVLWGFSHDTIYKSFNHGLDWISVGKLELNVPEGYESVTLSPTCGIQLSNGILLTTGRAIKWKLQSQKETIIDKESAFLVYSADYGVTWSQSLNTPSEIICDESIVAEYPNNKVVLNARGGTEYYWKKSFCGRRILIPKLTKARTIKEWGVKGWRIDKSDGEMWDPLCNASIKKIDINNKSYYLFCNPFMPGDFAPRRNLQLQISKDCRHWKPVGIVSPFSEIVYGYCTIAANKKDIFLGYEANDGIRVCNITDVVLNSIMMNFAKKYGAF